MCVPALQVDQQPSWVHGAPLLPHQLQACAWLRSSWLQHRPAVLADDQGLGKTASAVAFIASLLQELKATAPVLIVAPLATLSFWEGARGAVGALCFCRAGCVDGAFLYANTVLLSCRPLPFPRHTCAPLHVLTFLLPCWCPACPAVLVLLLGELAFWLPANSHIVVYSGSVAARAMLQVRLQRCVGVVVGM